MNKERILRPVRQDSRRDAAAAPEGHGGKRNRYNAAA